MDLSEVRKMKKDELFEPYYKLGLNHFINKEMLGLKRPKDATLHFYFLLMTAILLIAILLS